MSHFNVGRNIAIGTAVVLSFTLARAADDLPKAETILDKYIEATGGKAAYQKHHTEVSKGTFEMAAMGIKGDVMSYKAEPDKSLTEVDLTGIGKVREGSDGKVYWQINPMQGPHVKDGAEKAQAILTGRFNGELNWRELFKDTKTVGTDTVDGKTCYKVELTPAEGSPVTQCYDKESNLMVKMSMTVQGPMGDMPVDSFVSDYRKEGDVLMPHKIKQSQAGQEIVISIDSVTFNAEIPADKFAIPDEIKALVNKPADK
jgi:outer membrane lipoprotein-sorting protein